MELFAQKTDVEGGGFYQVSIGIWDDEGNYGGSYSVAPFDSDGNIREDITNYDDLFSLTAERRTSIPFQTVEDFLRPLIEKKMQEEDMTNFVGYIGCSEGCAYNVTALECDECTREQLCRYHGNSCPDCGKPVRLLPGPCDCPACDPRHPARG